MGIPDGTIRVGDGPDAIMFWKCDICAAAIMSGHDADLELHEEWHRKMSDVASLRASVDELRTRIGVVNGMEGKLPADPKLAGIVEALDLIAGNLEGR